MGESASNYALNVNFTQEFFFCHLQTEGLDSIELFLDNLNCTSAVKTPLISTGLTVEHN